MEDQRKTSTIAPDAQAQTQESNPLNPVSNGGESVKEEVAHESSGRPPFAIPQPMREEQVQNAVNFLSHPKVKGSPVIFRRAFLEKKGLSKEEIDEAFRRVPDSAPSNAAGTGTTTTNQANQASQPNPSTALQPQAPIQTLQPVAGGSSLGASLQQPRLQWKHALFAIGVLTASGAATGVLFKKMVVPRLQSWVQKVVEKDRESKKEVELKSSLAEEAAEAAKAAASAAAIVAKASQELVNAKNEESKRLELFMEMMDMQMKEMKSMSKTIRELEMRTENGRYEDKSIGVHTTSNGTTNNSWRNSQVDHSEPTYSSVFPKQVKVNGTSDSDFGTVRPSSAPASVEPLAQPPHPKSYMEIMAMIQRGEKPPGIKEINDMPPNPNQPPSKPVLAPRPKPWEIPQQSQPAPNYGYPYQTKSDPQPIQQTVSQTSSDDGSVSELQDNGQPSQPNDKAHLVSEPWWGKKTVKLTELDETDEMRASSARPNQRAWVPPQPPAVVMSEAATAIRQPKASVQKRLSSDDDISVASNLEDTENEAARTTVSVAEVKYPSNTTMDLNHSEIQEERMDTVEVNN
ncbi:peroxisomal membrane protein PEX14 isoform X1 [Dioscorea cayenensis subsp. rotundata]|uniref:Peroxisomal membrane protein PEX14 n=1 Tax=Dioscorea cayennensis subsp. rotundata TaxID=55577 RepID=A0AB40CUQ1_DIOCR|nr:peroxisomal membrane protein PEX14 isoform X1 [Dioscorea cayenensis subsp. rotundata]